MLATILTKYKVLPTSKDEFSGGNAREDILKLVAGSTASMAVNLAEPEELWLKLVER